MLKAKKSLGATFFAKRKALNTIVESIPTKTTKVFEIGPGEGVLTEKLLAKGFTVHAIEIDRRSIELLKEKFAEEIEAKKLFIIEKDCLEVDYGDQKYSLVGNIPYYITGAIFRHAFEQKIAGHNYFLIQKEVAQRIVANDKKESLLSVSIKIFSNEVKILEIVKRGSFVPPPKVNSAIIKINNIISPFKKPTDQEIFFKILRAAFSHKRKLMLANLKTDLEKDLYEKIFEKIKEIILQNYSEKVRAEDIEVKIWLKLIRNVL